MGRKRKHDVRVRMSDTEYALLKNRIDETGISIQDYGVRMLLEQPVVTRLEKELLLDISKELHEVVRIHRGIGNNINQLARRANTYGYEIDDFEKMQKEYIKDRIELERMWAQTRRLISSGDNKND